tara:strand:+ start:536 stop:952 length:417 start_codon:yes stop_codon:yes gene_type:complete
MLGGKKSSRGSVKFYSVYDRKSVKIPRKSVCCKTMKTKRGTRHALFAQDGKKKFYKFISASDAEKYGKCRSRKSRSRKTKSKPCKSMKRKSCKRSKRCSWNRNKKGTRKHKPYCSKKRSRKSKSKRRKRKSKRKSKRN